MRPEKAYLIEETSNHLAKSNYFFLTDYQGINAEETTELRKNLADRGAEFHVVKNSSLKLATKDKDISEISTHLSGHTAIVVGGADASGVAKALGEYFKKTKKVTVKAGALGDRLLDASEIKQLAKLPGLESLRAQLLSLISSPSTQLVSLLSAPSRGFVTVLKAKAGKN